MGGCSWIKKYAAFDQGTVNISGHRSDVPGCKRPRSSFILHLAILDIVFYALGKFNVIAFVYGVDRPVFGNGHIGMRETELTDGRIQRKAVYAFSGSIYQHG